MILICSDGSDDAHAAIDHAAHLMPGAQATVLTVWEPFIETLTRSGSMGMGLGMVGTYGDAEAIDAASQQAALARATDGAQRATAAGLIAEPLCATRHGSIAHTVLATSAALDAELIVMGTRGLSGLMSIMLGSVSHAVVQHADRAVLVVPSPALAEHRRVRVDEQVTAPWVWDGKHDHR